MTSRKKNVWIFICCAVALAILIFFEPGYGWRVRKSLALAMVRPDLGEIGTMLDVVILGATHRATVIAESPYDADNARLRAE